MAHYIEDNSSSDNELKAGSLRHHFLISMPGLQDPNFSRSITYICDHNEDGAMGLVVNRPMDLSINDIFEQLDLEQRPTLGEQLVMAGGPVERERGFVLHTDERQWNSSIAIGDGIRLTASADILEAMATSSGPGQTLVALGYAGWGAGQLEEEIAENSWLTVPASAQILFNTPCELRWAAAAKSLGFDLDLLTSAAGHA